jgi:hypothetical protein
MTKRWSAPASRDGQTKRQASKAMRLKVPERDALKAAAPYYSPGSPRSLCRGYRRWTKSSPAANRIERIHRGVRGPCTRDAQFAHSASVAALTLFAPFRARASQAQPARP